MKTIRDFWPVLLIALEVAVFLILSIVILGGQSISDKLTMKIWSPLRGTLKPAEDWPYGSRQVRRRAMTAMYFNAFSRLDMPRRIRRLLARTKAKQVYTETLANMRETGTELTKPKTFFEAVMAKLAMTGLFQ